MKVSAQAKKKKFSLLIVLLLGLFLLGFALWKKAQADHLRDEMVFRSVLSQAILDLPPGTPRAEVMGRLQSQGLHPVSDSQKLIVKVGEESGDSFICSKWLVYLAFEFDASAGRSEPSPQDRLNNISIQKRGVCL